jgi:hypothetical protein
VRKQKMAGYEFEEVEREAVRLWRREGDAEALLSFARERGFDQPQSLRLLMEVTGMDLGKARDFIVSSRTWADRRDQNQRIQEELEQALFELSQEELPVHLKIEGEKEN